MKNLLPLIVLFAISCTSCSKEESYSSAKPVEVKNPLESFTKYHISKGAQYASNNRFEAVSYQELRFQVRFDESAIYKTTDPQNQYDINKLYGFSDNNAQHHKFSARIGWRWSNDSLRLFAYIYNNAGRESMEISAIPLGKIIDCSIKVESGKYIFTVDSKKVVMSRAATTLTGSGYRLYPYFGGDELAPHDIFIWIKEIN